MVPPPSFRSLAVQGDSGASIVLCEAGDVSDVFVCVEFQVFFLSCKTRACFAPRAPLIAVPEKEQRLLFEHFSPCADLSNQANATHLDGDGSYFLPLLSQIAVGPSVLSSDVGQR